MIQDIYPHIFHNHYDPGKIADEKSTVLHFNGNKILTRSGEYPDAGMLRINNFDKLIYLFSIDDTDYYLCDEEIEYIPEGYEYTSIRELRFAGLPDGRSVFVAFTAHHLAAWYNASRYCGRCGAKTYHDKVERAMRCDCGNVIYPRVSPAVIVAVRNGDRLLVTKYNRPGSYFALVAGFTEIGETLEETVRREVMEETGLKVKNITYYKSQPWGIAGDILAGFYCDLDGDDTITMDSFELKLAEWREREDIELQPDGYSLTNEMMKMFKEGIM